MPAPAINPSRQTAGPYAVRPPTATAGQVPGTPVVSPPLAGSTFGGPAFSNLYQTARGGPGAPIHAQPFGSLGQASDAPSQFGFKQYPNATGAFADIYKRITDPGSNMEPEDRTNLGTAIHLGSAAQDEYARGESEYQNKFQALSEILGTRTADLLNRNLQNSQGSLDMGVNNLNAFRGDMDQRKNLALAQHGRAVDAFQNRVQPVLGDTWRANSLLSGAGQTQDRQQASTLAGIVGNQRDRNDDMGGIRRGYGFRTGDISNTVTGVDQDMLKRQNMIGTSNADLLGQQQGNTQARFGEQAGLDSGYQNRVGDITSLLNLRGREASSDIERGAQRQQSQSKSDLIGRGLYNTTVTDSVSRGIEEDRARQQRGLREQLTEQELGLTQQLTQDQLENQRQTSDYRNKLIQQQIGQGDQNRQLLAQAQADRAGQNMQSAGVRSGLQADQLGFRDQSARFSNDLAQQLASLRTGQTAATVGQQNQIAGNAMEQAALRSALLGDAASARERGVDVRKDYDSGMTQPISQGLDSLLRTSEGQTARDTALGLQTSGSMLGHLSDDMHRRTSPNFIDLYNIFNASGSSAPPPITSTAATGSRLGLFGG